jgi:hypothetical protein
MVVRFFLCRKVDAYAAAEAMAYEEVQGPRYW